MQDSLNLAFENGCVAQVVRIEHDADLLSGLSSLGFGWHHPVLVVIGGASLLNEEDSARLQQLFVEVLAPIANDLGCFVIDGGTDAGVMKLMGDAKERTNFDFPLIGVSPIGLVKLPNIPNSEAEAAFLEPHHTHFILVSGNQWGDESPWLAKIGKQLAGNNPSVTILINGGAIALVDAQENIKVGCPVVAIAGSGRLADEIATAIRYPEQEKREQISLLLQEGELTIFDMSESLSQLEDVLRQKLSG